jgi:hypothetical protein
MKIRESTGANFATVQNEGDRQVIRNEHKNGNIMT